MTSLGTVEGTELKGLPAEAWPAGRDLTLTYTPVEHANFYELQVYSDATGSTSYWYGGNDGSITVDGTALTEGAYTLTFRPEPEDGYILAEGGRKTYTLTVEGTLPAAPSVTAGSTALTHGTVALTCTAEAVPEMWKVVRRWTEGYGNYEAEETFPGTSATEVLEAETCDVPGDITYTVSAKIDGVWSLYSDPVTVALQVGPWEAPRRLRLEENGMYASSVYTGTPYTIVWDGVGYGMTGYEVRVTDSGDAVLLQATVDADPDYGYREYALDFDGFSAEGDYTVAVRTLGDGVSGLDSDWETMDVTVSALQGRVEGTELAGLPEGAWPAGMDLTLTYTPAEHARYYALYWQRSTEDVRYGLYDMEGSFTLEGMDLTAGEYILTFQPEPEDGYVLAADAIKTYTLTVEGKQPAAPAVTLAEDSVAAGTEVALRCVAEQTPEYWLVRITFHEQDGDSYFYTETIPGEAAAQTLTLSANSRVGQMDFSVCAKADGVWSLYSDPVTVTLTPAPWAAPTEPCLMEGDIRAATVYPNQPYTLRWGGVGYGMAGYQVQATDSEGSVCMSATVDPDPDYGYKTYKLMLAGFPAAGEYTLAVRTLGDGVTSLDSDWAKITVTVRDFELALTAPEELPVNSEGTFHAAMITEGTAYTLLLEMLQADGSRITGHVSLGDGATEGDAALIPEIPGEAKVRASYYQSGEGYRYSPWVSVNVTSVGKLAAPTLTANTPQVEPGEYASISWTAVDNASGYRLTIHNPDGTQDGPTTYRNSASLSCSRQLLRKGTYRFELQLVGAPGWENSDPVSCTVASDTDKIFVVSAYGTLLCYFGADTEVVIPSQVDGITVKGINSSAFGNNTAITGVVIPGTVSSLSSGIFMGCTSLTSLTVPASVTSISSYLGIDPSALTIYGYTGSYAEAYAAENGIAFVALGAADAGNITFTLDRDVIHQRGTVKVTITAPDAEAVRLVVNGAAGSAYALADGVCTITQSFSSTGVQQLAVQQLVDGAWLPATEAKALTVGEPLAEPVVQTAGGCAYQPVTFTCAPVEDGLQYTLDLRRVLEEDSYLHLSCGGDMTLGEDGLWAFTTGDGDLTEAGTYEARVIVHAEDGAYTNGPWVSFALADAPDTCGDIAFTLDRTTLYYGSSITMTVTAPDAEAVRLVYGDGSVGDEEALTDGQCQLTVDRLNAGTQTISVQQKVDGQWLLPCEGQEVTVLVLAAPVVTITGDTLTRPVTFTATAVEGGVACTVEILWHDENGSSHSSTHAMALNEDGLWAYTTGSYDLTHEGDYTAKVTVRAGDGGCTSVWQSFALSQPAQALTAPVIAPIGSIPAHKLAQATWSEVEHAGEYTVSVWCPQDDTAPWLYRDAIRTDAAIDLISKSSLSSLYNWVYDIACLGLEQCRITVTARAEGYRSATASQDFTVYIRQLDAPDITLAEHTWWHAGETIAWVPVEDATLYTLTVTAHTADGDDEYFYESYSADELTLTDGQYSVTLAPSQFSASNTLPYTDCDYTVTLEASARYCLPASAAKDFTVETLPLDAPEIAAPAQAVGGETFTVSWDAVDQAQTYTVSLLNEEGQAVYGPVSLQNTALAVTLNQWVAKGSYTLQVQASRPFTNPGLSTRAMAVLPLYEYAATDGGVEITRYNGHEAEPAIPASIGGVPVTRIGDGAFEGNESVQVITLTSSVTEIGARAFKNCTALREFTGVGVTRVGEEAFYGCVNLETCELYRDSQGRLQVTIDQWAFYGCDKLQPEDEPAEITEEPSEGEYANNPFTTTITYGEGVRVIPARTHYANTGVMKVFLPASLERIGAEAFAQCGERLTGVTLYGSTGDIAEDAFARDPNVVFYIYTEDFDAVSPAQQYAIDHGIPYRLLSMPGRDGLQSNLEDTTLHLLAGWYVDFSLSGTYADRVVFRFGDGSVESYSFLDSHVSTTHVWSDFGTYAMTITTYNGEQQADQLAYTVEVTGNLLTVSPASVFTGDTVHFAVRSSEASGTMYFYADGVKEPFAQAEIVNGVAEADWAFTLSGQRRIRAVCDATGEYAPSYSLHRLDESWSLAEMDGKLLSCGTVLEVLALGQLEQPVLRYEPVQPLQSGLTLSWDATANTDGYRLYLLEADGSVRRSLDIAPQPGTEQQYTVPADMLETAGPCLFYLMNYGARYDQNQSGLGQALLVDEGSLAFMMDKASVTTGEDVTFTICAPGATRVQLWVDGAAYETAEVTDGRATLVRPFHQSGQRAVAFSALREDVWSEPCEAQLLSVTALGQLADVAVTLPSRVFTGADAPVSWTPVEHADAYTVYVYAPDNRLLLSQAADAQACAFTVPAAVLEGLDGFHVLVVATGAGYDQSEGSASAVISDALPGPVITSPDRDGQQVQGLTLPLAWEPVDGAESYAVSLAKKVTAADGTVSYQKVWAAPNETINVGSDTGCTLTGLAYGQEYRVAVGAVPPGRDGVTGTANVGWSERTFITVLPALSVTLSVSPSPVYEKQEAVITAVVSHADTTVIMQENTADGSGEIYSGSSDTVLADGRRVMTFRVTRPRQGKASYTVYVSGTGVLASAKPVSETMEIDFLDANAPAVLSVTRSPEYAWAGSDITFTVLCNAHTVSLDCYVDEGSDGYDPATDYLTLTDFRETAEGRLFTLTRSFAAGTHTLRLCPVNEDGEWVNASCSLDVAAPGKLPAVTLTAPAQGDILLTQSTASWVLPDMGGMPFHGFGAALCVLDEQADQWTLLRYDELPASARSWTLPDMTAGCTYRLELYTLASADVSDPDNGVAAVTFSYRTIPAFSLQSIQTGGALGEDVTVSWHRPVWPLAPALLPTRYVVWWYGPGLGTGYPMEVAGDSTSCTLPGSKVTSFGDYTVDVYALLDDAQRVAEGSNAFTVLPPQVTITTRRNPSYVSGDQMTVQGTVAGGVKTIVVGVYDTQTGSFVAARSDTGRNDAVTAATRAIDVNGSFSVNLTPASPLLQSTDRYQIRVYGFLKGDDPAELSQARAVDYVSLRISAGQFRGLWLNGSAVTQAAVVYTGSTVSAEVTTDGGISRIRLMEGSLSLSPWVEAAIPAGSGNSWTSTFRPDAFTLSTEGLHQVSVQGDNGAVRTVKLYAVTPLTAMQVHAASGVSVTLLAFPDDAAGATIPAGAAMTVLGAYGDMYYVLYDGMYGFVPKDSAAGVSQSGWSIVYSPVDEKLVISHPRSAADTARYVLVAQQILPNGTYGEIRYDNSYPMVITALPAVGIGPERDVYTRTIVGFAEELRLSGSQYRFTVLKMGEQVTEDTVFLCTVSLGTAKGILSPGQDEYVYLSLTDTVAITWRTESQASEYQLTLTVDGSHGIPQTLYTAVIPAGDAARDMVSVRNEGTAMETCTLLIPSQALLEQLKDQVYQAHVTLTVR